MLRPRRPRPPAWLAPALLCPALLCAAAGDARAGADDVDVLVVAPHPDDETLSAAAAMARAVRSGRRVGVAILTNGDLGCERDGLLRQSESVEALAKLGVREEHVVFLGYPDGHLAELGRTPLPPVERRTREGGCGQSNTTYGARGRGHADEHTARTGSPATYTAQALVEDLAAVLARTSPLDVYVVHPMDDHPDHAATYAYLRRALGRWAPRRIPRLHRAVVHAGACWPNGRGDHEPCPVETFLPREELPALPDPWGRYEPRERVPLDGWTLTPEAKLGVLASYRSQYRTPLDRDWMSTFARKAEHFYPEVLVPSSRAPGRLRRTTSGERASVGWSGAEGVLEVEIEASDRVAWRFVYDGPLLRLFRVDEDGSPRALARWPLPHDFGTQPAAVDVLLDEREDDGGVVELTVRLGGEVLGVAIDPDPPRLSRVRANVQSLGAATNR